MKIKIPNLNGMLFISKKKSNAEKLVGVSSLPPIGVVRKAAEGALEEFGF